MRSDYTILVSDHYPTTCAFIVEALASEGYRVVCRPDPDVTVEDIRAVRPDLVILELRRVDQDQTLLLLDQIRRLEATRATPMLVTSTDPRLLHKLAMPLQHLDCVTLAKPFALDQLLEYVVQALGSPRTHPGEERNELAYD